MRRNCCSEKTSGEPKALCIPFLQVFCCWRQIGTECDKHKATRAEALFCWFTSKLFAQHPFLHQLALGKAQIRKHKGEPFAFLWPTPFPNLVSFRSTRLQHRHVGWACWESQLLKPYILGYRCQKLSSSVATSRVSNEIMRVRSTSIRWVNEELHPIAWHYVKKCIALILNLSLESQWYYEIRGQT